MANPIFDNLEAALRQFRNASRYRDDVAETLAHARALKTKGETHLSIEIDPARRAHVIALPIDDAIDTISIAIDAAVAEQRKAYAALRTLINQAEAETHV